MPLPTPHRGGKISHGPSYPSGKVAWRCAWCGLVNPWGPTWGGWWSILEEESGYGLLATDTSNHVVWCSPDCMTALSPWCGPATVEVRRKPRQRR
jgi:hypothetical protein